MDGDKKYFGNNNFINLLIRQKLEIKIDTWLLYYAIKLLRIIPVVI